MSVRVLDAAELPPDSDAYDEAHATGVISGDAPTPLKRADDLAPEELRRAFGRRTGTVSVNGFNVSFHSPTLDDLEAANARVTRPDGTIDEKAALVWVVIGACDCFTDADYDWLRQGDGKAVMEIAQAITGLTDPEVSKRARVTFRD